MGEAEQAMDRLSTQTIRGGKVDIVIDDVSTIVLYTGLSRAVLTPVSCMHHSLPVALLLLETSTVDTTVATVVDTVVTEVVVDTAVTEAVDTVVDVTATGTADLPLVVTTAGDTTTEKGTENTATDLLVVEVTETGRLLLEAETPAEMTDEAPLLPRGRGTSLLPGVAMTASKCNILDRLPGQWPPFWPAPDRLLDLSLSFQSKKYQGSHQFSAPLPSVIFASPSYHIYRYRY
jgi:hypothetical protein